jgi:hypothetical protein
MSLELADAIELLPGDVCEILETRDRGLIGIRIKTAQISN